MAADVSGDVKWNVGFLTSCPIIIIIITHIGLNNLNK